MNTRTQLLDVAAELVRTRGYNGFSYADLSARVGLRKASIHHHFPTKEALGLALVDDYIERFDVALDGIRSTEPTAMAQLQAYVQIYRASLLDGRGCLCGVLAAELDSLPADVTLGVERFLARQVQWLAERIAAGQATGELRPGEDPRALAEALLAICQGALLVSRSRIDASGFDRATRALLLSFSRHAR
jgi:TetR/AcrR family transcriptional regulator, transcriptional repressor for nem operon